MSISHWVPMAPTPTRRRVLVKALCGAMTDASNHSSEPTCHECQDLFEELHARELAEEDAFTGIVSDPVKPEEFTPLAGYVPRGEKRKDAR